MKYIVSTTHFGANIIVKAISQVIRQDDDEK